jgi:hypothetical protein
MNFWVFPGIVDLQKYGFLTVLFSSRILTPAASSPMIIKHIKIKETT